MNSGTRTSDSLVVNDFAHRIKIVKGSQQKIDSTNFQEFFKNEALLMEIGRQWSNKKAQKQ